MYEDLRIIFYPDPRLRKPSEPVTAFDADLAALAAKMIALMHAERGVGLAAPQVGVNVRMFVTNHTGQPGDDQIVVNPRLLDAEGSETDEEGCLSLGPKIRAEVDRATRLRLVAQDVQGRPFERVGDDFLARIWQHEFDHLNGVMIIDRMNTVARMAVRKKLKELEADFAPKQRSRLFG
jgi:peptide deformylase